MLGQETGELGGVDGHAPDRGRRRDMAEDFAQHATGQVPRVARPDALEVIALHELAGYRLDAPAHAPR